MFFTVTEINLLKRKAGECTEQTVQGKARQLETSDTETVRVCIDCSNLITVRSTENACLPYRALQWFVVRPVSSILHRPVSLALLFFFAYTEPV